MSDVRRRLPRALLVGMILIIVLHFLRALFFMQNTEKTSVVTVSLEDRKILTSLFEELIRCSPCGYTLFGDKPMSLIRFEENFVLSDFWFKDKLKLFIHVGLPILKKYNSSFQKCNFIVHDELKNKTRSLYLINKKEFLKTVQSEIRLFRSVLGDSITPEQVLSFVSKEDCCLDDALRGNCALFGILYGFGSKNSDLFYRREQVERMVSVLRTPPWKCSLPNDVHEKEEMFRLTNELQVINEKPQKISPLYGCKTLSEELEFLNKRLQPVRFRNMNISIVQAVDFLGEPDSEETVQLISKYEFIRQKMIKIVVSGKAFECTLEKLCEN